MLAPAFIPAISSAMVAGTCKIFHALELSLRYSVVKELMRIENCCSMEDRSQGNLTAEISGAFISGLSLPHSVRGRVPFRS